MNDTHLTRRELMARSIPAAALAAGSISPMGESARPPLVAVADAELAPLARRLVDARRRWKDAFAVLHDFSDAHPGPRHPGGCYANLHAYHQLEEEVETPAMEAVGAAEDALYRAMEARGLRAVEHDGRVFFAADDEDADADDPDAEAVVIRPPGDPPTPAEAAERAAFEARIWAVRDAKLDRERRGRADDEAE